MKQAPGEFTKNVWKLARQIPSGRVTTYGLLATSAGGHPMLARMITHLLSKAPDAESMPWHRIVHADGRPWKDDRYWPQRLKLYQQEGIKLDSKDRIIDFEKIIFTFN